MRFYPGRQLYRAERLYNIVIRPEPEPFDFIYILFFCSDKKNRNIGLSLIALQISNPLFSRQHQIQQYGKIFSFPDIF